MFMLKVKKNNKKNNKKNPLLRALSSLSLEVDKNGIWFLK